MCDIPVSYDNPLTIIETEIESEVKNEILSVCKRIGINVDEETLYQALVADRNRYEEAYRKGYFAAMNVVKERLSDIFIKEDDNADT